MKTVTVKMIESASSPLWQNNTHIIKKLNINYVNWTLSSHWLVNWFVVFGAPYMAQDIYAMYLSHYHIQRVRGHSGLYSSHSLQTVKAFLTKDWMLVLHHLVLLLIFMPITLVRLGRKQCLYLWLVYMCCSKCVCFAVLQKRTGWFLYWLPVHNGVQHSFRLLRKDSHPGKPF